HLPSDNDGVSVLAAMLGNYRPRRVGRSQEFALELIDGSKTWSRTIDQRDDSSVPPAVEHLLQADLQGAELAPVGIAVDHRGRSVGVDHRREVGFIPAHHHDDQVGQGLQRTDGGGKKSSVAPRQQRLVATHARRRARRQYYSGKGWGKRHG